MLCVTICAFADIPEKHFALGAIFEQSLKDITKGDSLVRGVGETEVTTQEAGGVYYTPREIGLIAVLCGWDAQPVGFVVWRIGESRSSGRCETLSFSKRR